MQFTIAIPQFVPDGEFDPVGFRHYLQRAEELEYAGAWAQEQVFSTHPTFGTIETMTYAAACTERIRLGCAVLVFPLHSPVHLAKSISSLDQLSRGRIEIGLVAGGQFRMYSAFGITSQGAIARFNEGLRLMRALWTEARVDFEGRFFQLQGAAMEPKPFQKPGPPIWFGGNHPDALRRAVVHADGWIGAGSTTTAQFVERADIVRRHLADVGRDPSTFRIAKRVYVAVDDHAERARQRLSTALRELYGFFGPPDLTPVTAYGPPHEVAAGLREIADAGAEMVLLNPMFDDLEQMEWLAAEVVPALSQL